MQQVDLEVEQHYQPTMSSEEYGAVRSTELTSHAASLSQWLSSNVRGWPAQAPLQIKQFSHGQSNPT